MILSVTLPGYAQEVATPMALDQSSLSELLDALRSGGDLDFMRQAMQVVLQALIDLEATLKIGARPLQAQRGPYDAPRRQPVAAPSTPRPET